MISIPLRRPLALGLLAIAFAACAGCPPPNPQPPGPGDGGPGDAADDSMPSPPAPVPPAPPAPVDAAPGPSPQSDCARACANLVRLGCPEGSTQGAGCTATCTKAQAEQLTDFKPACLAAAADVTALRACHAPVKCTGK